MSQMDLSIGKGIASTPYPSETMPARDGAHRRSVGNSMSPTL
jgi:hypothetical protein